MSRYMRITLVSFILSMLLWFMAILINSTGFLLYVIAVIFSLLFICFLIISITEKVCSKFTPYRVFAIVNGCVGVSAAAYAIYDIKIDTGWFSGLIGVLLLITGIPIVGAFLLADFIIWRIKKRKKPRR